jgi:hypothetical protein
MEMAVRSMETAETAMEIDGDGSGGTSPSRQGAGTETSYRCSGYRGIPVHLLLGPVIGPSSAQGKDNKPSYGEDPHEGAPREENDDGNC